MKKVCLVKGIEFLFSESTEENLWYGQWNDISIEFFINRIVGEWKTLEKFLLFLEEKNTLNESIIKNSLKLLICLAETFWKMDNTCFKFVLSGINFNGLGTSFSSVAFSYDLVFDLIDANGDGIDDSYANWLITMSDNHITGVRREQI